MDDHLIIELFSKRNEQAIFEASNKYSKLCHKLSYLIVGDDSDAQECVNDTLLAVWNSIPPDRPDSLSAYLCKITRNLSLKKYRSNTAQKRNSFCNTSIEEIGDCIASSFTVESELDADTLTQSINDFLETLKPFDRKIFVQRYWFCLEVQEIAQNINKSENYVSVHLHRTKVRLKKHLSKEELL